MNVVPSYSVDPLVRALADDLHVKAEEARRTLLEGVAARSAELRQSSEFGCDEQEALDDLIQPLAALDEISRCLEYLANGHVPPDWREQHQASGVASEATPQA